MFRSVALSLPSTSDLLMKECDVLKNEVQQLRQKLEKSERITAEATNLLQITMKRTLDSAVQILVEKMQRSFKWQNLPPSKPFLIVSTKWVEGFENILQNMEEGVLT